MAEEMRLHLEWEVERKRAAGMSADAARDAALREFGNMGVIQQRAREARGWIALECFWQDVRYGVRSLRKSTGFTAVIVLTLGLGVGVNSALFTWFNAAAFRPLPVLSPEQIYSLHRLDGRGGDTTAFAYADFVAYREHQTVFTGVAAVGGIRAELADASEFASAAGEAPVQIQVEAVSTNFFAVFGVPMALGRPLLPDDESSTRAQPVMVVSHRFWQNYLGADPAVIGRTLRFRGLVDETLTIVGVSGEEFHGTKPGSPVGWVPLLQRPGSSWRTDLKATNYQLTGRLGPGMAREQAEDELKTIANEFLQRREADSTTVETITLSRASSYVNLTPQQMLLLLPVICLFGAVLLVSCANASNLILARAVTRQFEFAVRSALGATRWRLFAQIMTESLMLGLLGGLFGWAVSAGLLRFVWPWLLDMVPMAREGTAGLNLHADHRVLGFTLLISLLAGMGGGLFPALQVTRRNVDSGLKREGSAFGRGIRLSRVRGFLVIVQLALSAALLFTAGLLAHRALQMQYQDAGFDKGPLLTYEVLAPRTYDASQLEAARRQVLERLRASPEVAAISEMPSFPFASARTRIVVPDVTSAAKQREVEAVHLAIPANYFSTLQLPVLRGRGFAVDERASDRVIVISETAARMLWPGEEAVGRSLAVPDKILPGRESVPKLPDAGASPPLTTVTVVGVVRDVRIYDTWSGERPVIFLPWGPQTKAGANLLIRTHEASIRPPAAFRQLGLEATSLAPRVATVPEVFSGAFITYQLTAWVAVILAGLSLVVAVIGLYGMMSFTIDQREKEIGIRIALGATPRRVIASVVREALLLVGLGAAAGYGLSMLIAVGARTFLFGVDASDPIAGIAVILLLGVVGLVACWMPARRAAKVDPVVALRAE